MSDNWYYVKSRVDVQSLSASASLDHFDARLNSRCPNSLVQGRKFPSTMKRQTDQIRIRDLSVSSKALDLSKRNKWN